MTGPRKWLCRLVLVVAAPAVVLAAAEGVLWLCGYGYSTRFLVRTPSGDAYTANETFSWRFHCRQTPDVFSFPAVKPAGAVRIFLFGESAAWGVPDPSYSFGRILAVMLETSIRCARIEMVNTAMMGINFHAILPIVTECARHGPDLFVLYMGNNEAAGFCAPGPESWGLTRHRSLIRARLWAKTTRLGQWLTRLITVQDVAAVQGTQDAEFFQKHRRSRDDPERAAVYDNFRANLRDMCRAARAREGQDDRRHRGGEPARFASLRLPPPPGPDGRGPDALGCGLRRRGRRRGCRPTDDAIGHYRAAAEIDDQFADLHFQVPGPAWPRPVRPGAGRLRPGPGLRRPALPADTPVNDAIREVAGGQPDAGIELVHVERALADFRGQRPRDTRRRPLLRARPPDVRRQLRDRPDLAAGRVGRGG